MKVTTRHTEIEVEPTGLRIINLEPITLRIKVGSVAYVHEYMTEEQADELVYALNAAINSVRQTKVEQAREAA